MSIIIIDADKAIDLIDAAVAVRGEDWVYPDTGQCRYIYDPEQYISEDGADPDELTSEELAMVAYFGDEKQPACLVGLALCILDPQFAEFLWQENENSVEGIMGTRDQWSVMVAGNEYVFERSAVNIFQTAQSKQDVGEEWGKAKKAAHNRYAMEVEG